MITLGATQHKETYTGRGDYAHTFLMRGTIGVGTPHNIERMKFPYLKLGGWAGGWGSLHNTASLRLHLASWNLKDLRKSTKKLRVTNV